MLFNGASPLKFNQGSSALKTKIPLAKGKWDFIILNKKILNHKSLRHRFTHQIRSLTKQNSALYFQSTLIN
jgi:hypothetical protein